MGPAAERAGERGHLDSGSGERVPEAWTGQEPELLDPAAAQGIREIVPCLAGVAHHFDHAVEGGKARHQPRRRAAARRTREIEEGRR
jgi:hypothetical protein